MSEGADPLRPEPSHRSAGVDPLSTPEKEYPLPASNQPVVAMPEKLIDSGLPKEVEENAGGLGGVPPPTIEYPIETLYWW